MFATWLDLREPHHISMGGYLKHYPPEHGPMIVTQQVGVPVQNFFFFLIERASTDFINVILKGDSFDTRIVLRVSILFKNT